MSCKLALAALLATCTPAFAQTPGAYPAKAVRIIVPFPPGSGADITTRLLTPKLVEMLGQPFIVDNRAGAAGNIGAEIAARSPADGYTLLIAPASLAIGQTLYARPGFDLLKDFEPIALTASVPFTLVVHPSLPAKSVQELVAIAKTKPGRLTYGSTGNGSSPHLTTEMLKLATGIDTVHVPYKGTPPALTDLLSGTISFMFANSLSVLPHVQNGRLRALAVTSAKRSATMPQLPTVAEAYSGFESGTWFALLAPAATPRGIVEKLNAAVAKVVQMPEVREQILAQGAEPLSGTPHEVGAYLRAEVAKWGSVVKASGAKVE
jgi:tripartite-type tricarboxylate transporter receptor subunit TctC